MWIWVSRVLQPVWHLWYCRLWSQIMYCIWASVTARGLCHMNIKMFKLLWCRTVDLTSVDTRSSEREAATFSRMHEITSSYQRSAIYQNMLGKMEQSLQRADKPAIPFKSKESPSDAAKLEVLLRSVLSKSSGPMCLYTPCVKTITHYWLPLKWLDLDLLDYIHIYFFLHLFAFKIKWI